MIAMFGTVASRRALVRDSAEFQKAALVTAAHCIASAISIRRQFEPMAIVVLIADDWVAWTASQSKALETGELIVVPSHSAKSQGLSVESLEIAGHGSIDAGGWRFGMLSEPLGSPHVNLSRPLAAS